MTKRVWRSGPPPHVGWWNARVIPMEYEDRWSWWDGKGWSAFSFSGAHANLAAERAQERGGIYNGPGIQWRDYWPENARVPRVNPNA